MPLRLPRLLPLLIALLLGACTAPGPTPVKVEPAAPPPLPLVVAPTVTRGEFLIEADKLDTWNAVGQIAVRTPGVEYEGRAQMLDLYSLRYRGESFMVLTKALPLSGTITRLTTKVTATTLAGKPIDSDAVAELLALLHAQLPAEIADVRARQAAEKKAKATKKRKKKT